MYSKMKTTAFIESCFAKRLAPKNTFADRLAEAQEALHRADHVLIGAGSGLSSAAGIDYSGPRFQAAFADYIRCYGFTDLYTSSFYDFPSEEARWAYWAKHIDFARFAPPATELYRRLLQLVAQKDYFVITTNVDGQFRKAGFDPDRLFEVQGDYAYLQCAHGCHPTRYYDEQLVHDMLAATHDCLVPTALVPHCPVCGGPMEPNLRKDRYFVEDDQWHAQADRYTHFVEQARLGRTVLLEFGIGYNTPSIIRFPFENMAARSARTTLIRFNRDFPNRQLQGIGAFISFPEDTAQVVRALLPTATE